MTINIREKATELESLINWNYIGIAAAILTIIVSAYNIKNYIVRQKELK